MMTAPDTGPDRKRRGLGQWASGPSAEQTADSGSGTCVAGSGRALGPHSPPSSSLAAPVKPSPRPQRIAGTPSTEPVHHIIG